MSNFDSELDLSEIPLPSSQYVGPENQTDSRENTEDHAIAGPSSQLDNVFDIDATASADLDQLLGRRTISEPFSTSTNNNTAAAQDNNEAPPRANPASQIQFPAGSAQAAIAQARQAKGKDIPRPTSNTTFQPLQGKRKGGKGDDVVRVDQDNSADKRTRMG